MWTVQILPSALDDLRYFPVYAQRIIEQAVNQQLAHAPLVLSKNLKELRPNLVASHELRVQGAYRILYNTELYVRVVTIVVIGQKRGNALFVRGKEYRDHENYSSN